MEKVVISGGTGLIGKYLSRKLQDKGYTVAHLSRMEKQDPAIHTYYWDVSGSKIEKEAIETADYVIHLAGAGIGEKRWTTKRRKVIQESRIKSAQLIFDQAKMSNKHLKAFISASAIGYYGANTADHIFKETDQPANDFLGETCRLWEKGADRFQELGIRTVKIRTGVVLTRQGGVLAKLLAPVKMGIGSAIGTGSQYMPWIHIEDLCNIYIRAIEDKAMSGDYNAVAPIYKTNKEFLTTLAAFLHKPFWFPHIPSFMMRILYGEMANMLLTGSRVSSDKIISQGFTFSFPDLESALKDLL
jgi:uncharacterized protein (TIGR01777 family)